MKRLENLVVYIFYFKKTKVASLLLLYFVLPYRPRDCAKNYLKQSKADRLVI